MVLNFVNSRHETALLAQKYIDNNIGFTCNVEPFKNKLIPVKFLHGKTYKIAVYGYKGRHCRNKTRILSAANVIKAIELGCALSDKVFSRIKFKDGNPLNYHLDNIELRYLEYQKAPYMEGTVLGIHLGNPDAKKQCKRRPRAIVMEQDGYTHETMYYRYVYETYLGEKLPDDVEIDHMDGNVLNNSITNLRTISLNENRLKSRLCAEGNTFNGVLYNRYKCPVCGKCFDREAADEGISKNLFCSPTCNGAYYATRTKETADVDTEIVLRYIKYDYLTSALNAGPISFANIISCVRFTNPSFVFPIISKISELIKDPVWHDVLYYTYSNQIKLGLNRNEAPEVIQTISNFIRDYEVAKTSNYIFNIMNNKFVYVPEFLPNQYKFQSKTGVTPFDKVDEDGYVVQPKQQLVIPELHHFVL